MELREILPQARRLEACISLEVGEVADRPGMFVLSERWRNGNEYLNEILQLPFSGTWNAAKHSTQLHEQFSSSRQSQWVLCLEQLSNNAADGLKPLVLRSSFFANADLSR